MNPVSNQNSAIIRTERGLTLSGTRITLYDIIDYLNASYPPKFICALFDLKDEQLNAALSYIEEHRSEVEAEYQLVLKQAEEIYQYWEERNREHLDRVEAIPPPPNQEALWKKLQEQKARHQLDA